MNKKTLNERNEKMKAINERLQMIVISDRIWLWFNDDGFRFVLSGLHNKPAVLEKWDMWRYFWPLYKQDEIINKCCLYMDTASDHQKSRKWFQSMSFEAVLS
jgi:hypothetical protein